MILKMIYFHLMNKATCLIKIKIRMKIKSLKNILKYNISF